MTVSESLAKETKTRADDEAFHAWYQLVLGYPPRLVRHYAEKFGVGRGDIVLDPFCGTGTTNVECKKRGLDSIGVEANPIGVFASTVKTRWHVEPSAIQNALREVLAKAYSSFAQAGLAEQAGATDDAGNELLPAFETGLTAGQRELLPKGFVSPRPLRRLLLLRELIAAVKETDIRDLMLLALAKVAVGHAANVGFGPEIYAKRPKDDVFILDAFAALVETMAGDLEGQSAAPGRATIHGGDARVAGAVLRNESGAINAVITSPPYPNEKDYTRNTRIESVLLGFIEDKAELRKVKESLLRSNSRNVFAGDEDGRHIERFPAITALAGAIEQKRLDLKKTSGFEKQYHKVVRHYFGGMHRHFASLKPCLAPGARLAYVVGDQRSFFRIPIRTAHLLAEVAESLGYRIEGIELWRRRQATATRQPLDENVLILRNP